MIFTYGGNFFSLVIVIIGGYWIDRHDVVVFDGCGFNRVCK